MVMGEVRLLVCGKCSHWKCEKLSYEELLQKWHKTIGGTVTPGHLKRYKRVALEKGVSGMVGKDA